MDHQCRRFEGRVALITGGARGIGAATARRLTEEGAQVAVADVDRAAAEETAGALPGAIALTLDVRSSESAREAVAETVRRLGGLDLLVNNAFSCSADEPVDSAGAHAAWDLDLDVTLSGAFRCLSAAFDALADSGHGAVVNVGSVNGAMDFGNHGYSAAKAGLESLTRTFAGDGGPRGVRVNLVMPGTVATRNWAGQEETLRALGEQHYPLGRVGRPDDIASAIAFLGSDDAAWITGTTLRVDGGLLAVNAGFAATVGEYQGSQR